MARPVTTSPRILRHTRSPVWWGLVLLLVALLASHHFVGQMSELGQRSEQQQVLARVQTAAALLDAAQVAALHGTPADAGTPTHEHLRASLRAIRVANPEFRFVYLMRPLADRPDRFVFLADAEPPDSPDYSAPGDVYEGPSDYLQATLAAGEPQFSGRVDDPWGSWVSALAPIHHDGKVVAILGADLAHADWLANQGRYRLFALWLSALLLALICLFLFGLMLQRRAGERAAALGRQLAERVGELERAHESLRLADVVVRNTSEAIMVLDADFRVLRVNPAYERLSGRRAADVLGRLPPSMMEDSTLAGRIANAVAAGDHWQDEVWATRPDGTRYPVGALAEVVRDAEGRIEHFVVVLQDLSAQKEIEERLRELSATDGLTRIANRRTFDEWLEREWARGVRQQTPLSLVMADIDFFKRYNDSYGHVAGDSCLQQVAAALKAGVRQGGDLVARYGGEEFAVVLPGADAAAARLVAESLRQRVEALALPHSGNAATGVVTISLGVATRLPSAAQPATQLVELADQQLYRAKAGGRNRVDG